MSASGTMRPYPTYGQLTSGDAWLNSAFCVSATRSKQREKTTLLLIDDRNVMGYSHQAIEGSQAHAVSHKAHIRMLAAICWCQSSIYCEPNGA